MEGNQLYQIILKVNLDLEHTTINSLALHLSGFNLSLFRPKCHITLPISNIVSIAKNKLSLILFINNPDRPIPDENWG